MNEIDQYIASFSAEQQIVLNKMRAMVHEAAPLASEKISWAMPTFYFQGNIAHFAMNKAHIGLYPGPAAVEHFQEQLKPYKHSKGSIQFPLTKELPKELIQEIVRFNYNRSK